MGKLVDIKVGEYRGVAKYDLNNTDCNNGDIVILSIERGFEYGKVVSDVDRVCEGKTDAAQGKIVRIATDGDLKQIENNRLKSNDSLQNCLRRIAETKMDMQILNAEYTFDSAKLIFSFLSEERVDFRNFVKDLAKVFRVRIELKQVGVRDRAKVVGGYGVCGRELCCSSYMKGFHPLSIKMAKTQNLPLNPTRISGVCGRIKCCMAYEFQVYKEYAKAMPEVGDKVETPEGKGKVVDLNILKRLVYVDLGEGKVVKKAYSAAK